MKGLFYILCAYLVGEILSNAIGGIMPGSVLGMIVLFLALRLKTINSRDLKIPSKLLLNNMMLFFVPVGVGLMVAYPVIAEHIWAIVVSVVISTLLVMIAVGHLQQKLGRRG